MTRHRADKIYHVSIMPCYDKKLEASRSDFYNEQLRTRDVDCVLTSLEVVDLIRERGIDFASVADESGVPLGEYAQYARSRARCHSCHARDQTHTPHMI